MNELTIIEKAAKPAIKGYKKSCKLLNILLSKKDISNVINKNIEFFELAIDIAKEEEIKKAPCQSARLMKIIAGIYKNENKDYAHTINIIMFSCYNEVKRIRRDKLIEKELKEIQLAY